MSNFSLPLDFFRLTRIWKWMSIWFHYILGRTHNKLNILKAFLIGLLRQRTHQELANEKKLHLVEMRAEMGNFPVVSIFNPRKCFHFGESPPKNVRNHCPLTFHFLGYFGTAISNIFLWMLWKWNYFPIFLPLDSWKIVLNSSS